MFGDSKMWSSFVTDFEDVDSGDGIGLLIVMVSIPIFLLYVLPTIDDVFTSSTLEREDVSIPTKLHPQVNEAKNILIEETRAKGIEIMITDGHWTEEEQDNLYQQARSESGNIVTIAKGGQSYHNYGLAIDFALKLDNGNVVWDLDRDDNNNGEADWMEVVAIAKDLGFEWGGDWTSFKDYPHLQMDFGLSIRELQYGKRPKVEEYANKE